MPLIANQERIAALFYEIKLLAKLFGVSVLVVCWLPLARLLIRLQPSGPTRRTQWLFDIMLRTLVIRENLKDEAFLGVSGK
jgi:hypothetical protein